MPKQMVLFQKPGEVDWLREAVVKSQALAGELQQQQIREEDKTHAIGVNQSLKTDCSLNFGI